MCLAVPAIVIALNESSEMATVDLSGIQKDVSTVLVDDVNIGDYLLIHVGFALHKLSEKEAISTLALFEELEVMNNQDEQASS
ncbi:HypC/HybG/HupF family hydrogenase formation chaperone [Mariprofundus sp. EBB-1]|uniref:HypC/HybG/HupF family hydrogenase formation chaperone n=1 Tax=Mariprofundus sp. EBB-1 TaxID=2650971 RepID=UPI000EF2597F|nr:HypC/HybG/HupF family hydrogenase formation chaperone [Mariprofundus sp. EBB-1]RLL54330.1 HypC/HybG/HupF family hydrogenase formation chaperone [Mariprofundus sp. EBB-1]